MEEVFSALTNPFTIELWSGYPAVMQAKEGTEFSIFEGEITGRNLTIVEHKQIVQEWYFGDREELSIVTIEIKPCQNGSMVHLLHTNVPDEDFDNIQEGWQNSYWGAIQEFFK